MQQIYSVIKQLAELGVVTFYKDDKLKARTEAKELPKDAVEIIKTNKAALIDYHKQQDDEQKVIRRQNLREAPLSFAQQGLWFLEKRQGISNYNMFAGFLIEGNFNADKAEKAFQLIIQRHEILRTCYRECNDQPVQVVLSDFSFNIAYQTLNVLNERNEEAVYKQLATDFANMPFELTDEVMIRAKVLELTLTETRSMRRYLFVNISHLAADGWSIGVLLEEFREVYANLPNEALLSDIPVQYSDYAKWQREKIVPDEALEFWSCYLKGAPPAHNLRKRSTVSENKQGDVIKFVSRLPKSDSKALIDLAEWHGVTPFMCLHALVSLVVCRHSDSLEVVMGTSIANRHRAEIEPAIGLFANTVAFRISHDFGTWQCFIEHVKESHLKVQQHQTVPFEKIIDAAGVSRDAQSPIFQIMLVNDSNFGFNHKSSEEQIDLKDVSLVRQQHLPSQVRYDLSIGLNIDNEITVDWVFDNADFDSDLIDVMARRFSKLVRSLLSYSEQIKRREAISLNQIHFYDDSEFLKLTQPHLNYTDPDDSSLLHQRFEAQAKKTPDKPCIHYKNETLTYSELNLWANQLAHYIARLSPKPDDVIAIFLGRGFDVVASMLAVLKAGCAFTPIDPSLPNDRVEYLLNDSHAKVVLTNKALMGNLVVDYQKVLPVNRELASLLGESSNLTNPEAKAKSDNLAYVIYTSGSTGKPKGVMVEHRQIVNQNRCEIQDFELGNKAVVLHSVSFSFDPAIAHLFSPLNSGAQVVISEVDEALEPLIRHYKVTHASFPAAVLRIMDCESLPTLRFVSVGAEKCSLEIAHKWGQGRRFFYTYGPTEATVAASWGALTNKTSVNTLGTFIDNVYGLILDQRGHPVPDGIEGELYIGGAGVSRGYLNDQEKTEESFVVNPYAKEAPLLYRSGDIVRRKKNSGELTFVGRKDTQVKLNGFRIELSEVEITFNRIRGVSDCHVLIAHDGQGKNVLRGYYQTSSGTVCEASMNSTIKESLAKELPHYMVPTQLFQVGEWPLTTNGKLDIDRLPTPQVTYQSNDGAIPCSPKEKLLKQLWGSVLGHDPEQLSLSDDFFELGGDSILSIQLVSSAVKSGLIFTVKDIFSYPTVRSLAKAANFSNADKLAKQSSGKTSLLPIVHKFASDRADLHHFNQSITVRLPIILTVSQLTFILKELVNKHDVLRLSFNTSGTHLTGEFQKVDDKTIENCIFIYRSTGPEFSGREKIVSQLQKSFELTNPPLIRLLLETNTTDKSHLTIILHHFVIDGVSWRLLLDDLHSLLSKLKNNETLYLTPVNGLSYKQCVEKLLEYSNSINDNQRDYWQNIITSKVTELVCKAKADNTTKAFQRHLKLGRSLSKKILGQCQKAFNTRGDELLLAALAVALQQWRGGNSFRVMLEKHGRQFFDRFGGCSDTLGWFSTLHPVILEADEESIESTINLVKKAVRSVPDEGVGFGVLKYLTTRHSHLDWRESTSLSFNYLGQIEKGGEAKTDLAKVERYSDVSELRSMQYPIAVNAMFIGEQLSLNISLDANYFSDFQLKHFLSYLEQAFSVVTETCLMQSATEFSEVDFPLCSLTNEEVRTIQQHATELNRRVQDIYPSTEMQQGLILGSELNKSNYISQMLFSVEKGFNYSRFITAWQQVCQRHDVLRTLFWENEQGKSYQVVLDKAETPFEFKDLRGVPLAQQKTTLRNALLDDQNAGFEPSKGQLMRFVVFQMSDSKYQFLWSHHHALIDGWCLSVIFNEVSQYYETQGLKLSKAPLYRDYISWLTMYPKDGAKTFWRNKLSRIDSKNIIGIKSEAGRAPDEGRFRFRDVLDISLTHQLKQLCADKKITINAVLQAALGLVIQRYTNSQQAVFGTTVSGRPPMLDGSDEMLGLFINTVPVIIDYRPEQSIEDWLKDINRKAADSLEHSYLPLVDIIKQAPQHLQQGLFDILLVFENYPLNNNLQQVLADRGLFITEVESIESSEYGITFNARVGEQLAIDVNGQSRHYKEQQIKQFLRHAFETIKNILKSDLKKPLVELDILENSEYQSLLYDFNHRHIDYGHSKLISSRFEQQVLRCYDNIAAVHGDARLSYGELNQRANCLAHALRERGILKHSFVGIHAHRSLNFLVAILGIIKAGGAYVPIKLDSPKQRINYMVSDSDISVVVCDEQGAKQLSKFAGMTLLNLDRADLSGYSVHNPTNINEPEDCAYMLYTSGSTGKPKGALISHAGATNHIDAEFDILGFLDDDGQLRSRNILQSAACSSDVSVWQFLAPLFSGGYTVILDSMLDMPVMHSIVRKYQVHLMEVTPSILQEYVNYIGSLPETSERDLPLKWMMCGAEVIPLKLVNAWLELYPRIPVLNSYGATEVSDDVSACVIREPLPENQTNVPIGQPIPNINLYVLSPSLQLQPVGVPGQIAVSGVCVGKGYWRNDTKNREQFRQNPFKDADRHGDTLYLTGDIGCWNESGELMLVGRMDNQVKVRGFRVELGEIETALHDVSIVSEAAVLLDKELSEGRLVCYLVAKADREPDTTEVLTKLSSELPDYMVPTHVVWLSRMPLNAANKVDRKALAELAIKQDALVREPKNECEQKLRGIWAELLNKPVEGISTDQSFFSEGGHSLLVIRMLASIRKTFAVELHAKVVFDALTIRAIANQILIHQATTSVVPKEGCEYEEIRL